ncbi:MAG: thiamine-phosphate kinase [Marinobacter sp.]|nr:thiamine-phosphate kinase [Marinobacter sp.]
MGEFDLIRRFFAPLSERRGHPDLLLAIGDDCAIERVPHDRDLVFSIDTQVEGVHFPHHYAPRRIAGRALAAATSDLAAMGATPVCFTLALTLPQAESTWLSEFAKGLAETANRFELALAGGDTTRGPLSITIQVHGTVARDRALRRSGARPGDIVAVSGTLGDAGAALDYLDVPSPGPLEDALLARYHYPAPRLELGQALAGVASSAIDISDGLTSDLGHILEASGVGASIDLDRIPLSGALKQLKGANAVQLALHAGDDYELCVTIPRQRWQDLPGSVRDQLTAIGCIEEGAGLRLSDGNGREDGASQGYDHFGNDL